MRDVFAAIGGLLVLSIIVALVLVVVVEHASRREIRRRRGRTAEQLRREEPDDHYNCRCVVHYEPAPGPHPLGHRTVCVDAPDAAAAWAAIVEPSR